MEKNKQSMSEVASQTSDISYKMKTADTQWYSISDIETIDSPALLFYKDRIRANIRSALRTAAMPGLLRPHVKTNKSADICAMMMEEGVTKFKCATIAEAEMLGVIGAPDVLVAYQPVGPKIARLIGLVRRYPRTRFSCLIDNIISAQRIAAAFHSGGFEIDLLIDLNVGQNRTGIVPEKAYQLYEAARQIPGISIKGLHAYDGHITDSDILERTERCDEAFTAVQQLRDRMTGSFAASVTIVAGGSPTFPLHARRGGVECSPGTFVLWDWSYMTNYPEEPFVVAALILTRIVSIVNDTTIGIDLGHKSVASENPLPRVHFLNAPEAVPTGHSEEHMIVKVPDAAKYSIGDVLYGVPVHICPTVSMYERAVAAEDHRIAGEWKITARDKKISI
jgi:D-serine deaminase-like pyridoxal phosphate-dependent protein